MQLQRKASALRRLLRTPDANKRSHDTVATVVISPSTCTQRASVHYATGEARWEGYVIGSAKAGVSGSHKIVCFFFFRMDWFLDRRIRLIASTTSSPSTNAQRPRQTAVRCLISILVYRLVWFLVCKFTQEHFLSLAWWEQAYPGSSS